MLVTFVRFFLSLICKIVKDLYAICPKDAIRYLYKATRFGKNRVVRAKKPVVAPSLARAAYSLDFERKSKVAVSGRST